MRCLFGQQFELVQIIGNLVSRSAKYKASSSGSVHCAHEGNEDIEHDADYGTNTNSMGRARSETGLKRHSSGTSWLRVLPSHW